MSELGVLSVHCPSGLQTSIWTNGLEKFNEWSKSGKDKSIVEWDGTITKLQEDIDESKTFTGTINFILLILYSNTA